VTGRRTYAQACKTGGSLGAGCAGPQAGQTPEEEKNGIQLDLEYGV